MLLKPATALALSAIVSIASFTARSAVAAPASSESSVSASSQVKGSHHGKKDTKKARPKKGHVALHSAEPKSSPKLAASLSTKLDLKKASDKSHVSTSKKPTLAAAGKEVFIGGPTKHGASVKPASDKVEKPVVDNGVGVKTSGKLAVGPMHGSKGAMAKSGRSPARHGSAAKTETVEPSVDDHPVAVVDFRRGEGKGVIDTKVALPGAPVVVTETSVRDAKVGVKVVEKKAAPCFHEPIEFVRGAETDRFPMTTCDGAVAPLVTERLSVLGRPESAALPGKIEELASVKGPEIAPGIRRMDSGLVERVQVIADHFAKPGMPQRVSIVSGYRPGSTGSFHASAQALDFHLEGVPNEAVVDFCKTLDNTGCGYYPNSSFVHVDVRPIGTGHVAWIDTSGPGEAPHYVASWPPPPDPHVTLAEEDDAVNPYLKDLPALPVEKKVEVKAEMMRAPASINEPLRLKDWE